MPELMTAGAEAEQVSGIVAAPFRARLEMVYLKEMPVIASRRLADVPGSLQDLPAY